jgi:hypothetical protein
MNKSNNRLVWDPYTESFLDKSQEALKKFPYDKPGLGQPHSQGTRMRDENKLVWDPFTESVLDKSPESLAKFANEVFRCRKAMSADILNVHTVCSRPTRAQKTFSQSVFSSISSIIATLGPR